MMGDATPGVKEGNRRRQRDRGKTPGLHAPTAVPASRRAPREDLDRRVPPDTWRVRRCTDAASAHEGERGLECFRECAHGASAPLRSRRGAEGRPVTCTSKPRTKRSNSRRAGSTKKAGQLRARLTRLGSASPTARAAGTPRVDAPSLANELLRIPDRKVPARLALRVDAPSLANVPRS